MKGPLQNLTSVWWWTSGKYSPSRISQQALSAAPGNFNLQYVSLVWEYRVREYQKLHENQHVLIICFFSPYGVLCCWREVHWLEVIWQIYAGFHSSYYSSGTKKNKFQIWLLAQKDFGRLQLIHHSILSCSRGCSFEEQQTANNSVSHFLMFFSVLLPKISWMKNLR